MVIFLPTYAAAVAAANQIVGAVAVGIFAKKLRFQITIWVRLLAGHCYWQPSEKVKYMC